MFVSDEVDSECTRTQRGGFSAYYKTLLSMIITKDHHMDTSIRPILRRHALRGCPLAVTDCNFFLFQNQIR